jgi:Mg2+ and Co2+ transporter CorA
MAKSHWFHAKASNAKKKYLKKHPGSIYAGARGAATNGNGAAAYRAQVEHMRQEIQQLKTQLQHTHESDAAHNSLLRRLMALQRKLTMFKRAAMATARSRK